MVRYKLKKKKNKRGKNFDGENDSVFFRHFVKFSCNLFLFAQKNTQHFFFVDGQIFVKRTLNFNYKIHLLIL